MVKKCKKITKPVIFVTIDHVLKLSSLCICWFLCLINVNRCMVVILFLLGVSSNLMIEKINKEMI